MNDLLVVMAATDCLVVYKLLGCTSIEWKQKAEGSRKYKAARKPSDEIEGKMVAWL